MDFIHVCINKILHKIYKKYLTAFKILCIVMYITIYFGDIQVTSYSFSNERGRRVFVWKVEAVSCGTNSTSVMFNVRASNYSQALCCATFPLARLGFRCSKDVILTKVSLV